jgi:hypothetical protein
VFAGLPFKQVTEREREEKFVDLKGEMCFDNSGKCFYICKKIYCSIYIYFVVAYILVGVEFSRCEFKDFYSLSLRCVDLIFITFNSFNQFSFCFQSRL